MGPRESTHYLQPIAAVHGLQHRQRLLTEYLQTTSKRRHCIVYASATQLQFRAVQ